MMAKSEASSLRKTFLLGLGKGLSKKLLQSMKMMMALQVIRFGFFFSGFFLWICSSCWQVYVF